MHIPLIASMLAGVLGVLCALHVYWAFGGRRGFLSAIPQVDGRPAFLPTRAMTLVVAGWLAGAMFVALVQGALVPIPVHPVLPKIAAIVIGMIFLFRAAGEFKLVGFSKSVRGTAFATWDTWLFSPLCVLLGAGFLVIARG
jgi:hypothetical protein